MTLPDLAPRSTRAGVIVVWALTAVATLLVGTVVPSDVRGVWFPVAFGFVVIASFAVQLGYGRSQQFILRTTISILGGMLVMGLIGVGLGLAAMFAG